MSDDGGHLFIKLYAGDTGARATNDPNPFWESPSVWLSDAPGNGQFAAGNNIIQAGPPGRLINILVDSNSADQITGIFGQAWVANPGGGPQATQPTNHTPGPNPADTFPGDPGITVSSTSTGGNIVTVPWSTFEDTTNSLGDLHRCIGANVFATSDIGVPTEGININGAPGNPFSPKTRQKQAQRNVTLKPAPKGGQVRFLFDVPNFGGVGAQYELSVEELIGEDSLDQVGREHVLGLRVATVTGLDTVAIQQLRNSEFCRQLGQPIERALLAAGGEPVIVDSQGGYRVVAAENEAREAVFSSASVKYHRDIRKSNPTVFVPTGAVVPVALDVTIADDTPVGGVHTFQVKQWDEEGNIVGGNRFMALAATEELLSPCSCAGKRDR